MFGTRPDSRTTMATGLAILFGAGATLVFITLALPHAGNTDDLAVAVPPALAYLVAAALLLWGHRIAPAGFEVVLALGSLLITGCVVWGGAAASAYPLMYVWVALYAGWFFAPWRVVAQVAFTAALYAAVFAINDDVPVPQAHWVMAVGTAAVTSALVTALMRRLRAQAADLEAVATLAGGAAEPAAYAEDICRHLERSSGADLVALLVGDDELRMTASAGRGELLREIADLPAVLAGVRRDGAPATLCVAGPGARRVAGLAQPVLRDGAAVGVLVVAWRRPRRLVGDGVTQAAAVFAGQAAVGMERLERVTRERERRALELNDMIVQGLVVTKYALDAHDEERARESLDGTLEQAKRLVSEQLDEIVRDGGDIAPGDLAR